MTEKLLEIIGKQFPLSEKDVAEYGQMKVNGMKFTVRAYRAKGLGHVSVMNATGFFGLMKMDTLIITPTRVDMPLLSYDRVHAMGNDTLIFELYDTFLEKQSLSSVDRIKQEYGYLAEHDLGEHWYDFLKLEQSLSKKGKKAQSVPYDGLAKKYLKAYLLDAMSAPESDRVSKRAKADVYVEGLLTHGGPSTDVFKKGIGEEKTAELFRKYLFNTRI